MAKSSDGFVTIRVPILYKNLLGDTVAWLGLPANDRTVQYRTLKALVTPPTGCEYEGFALKLGDSLLFPICTIDGYILTRLFVQGLVDDYESIYSGRSLVEVLSALNTRNTAGKFVSYNEVYRWKINFYDRSASLAESASYRGVSVRACKEELDRQNQELVRLNRDEFLADLKSRYTYH